MSGLTENQIIGTVLALITLGLIVIAVMRYLAHRKRKVLEDFEEPSWSDDVAHNQIVTTRTIIERAEKNGASVSQARDRLKEAEAREKAGSYREAASLARAARDLIQVDPTSNSATKRRIPVQRDRTGTEDALRVRDLSKKPGEKEEPDVLPEPPFPVEDTENLGTAADVASMPEFRKSVSKNYLESRFELQMLGNEVKAGSGPQLAEAQKLLTAAEKAYDREDYTECLRLALRGRRVLGSTGLQTVTLSAATVVEIPPHEPLPAAKRSSAPVMGEEGTIGGDSEDVASTIVKCPRCGKANPSKNRFCRGCGFTLSEAKCPRCQVKVSPEDTFCGSCGAPLTERG